MNALLTQIDRLKSYENVIVLTTSNITEAIGRFSERLPGLFEQVQPVFSLHHCVDDARSRFTDVAFVDRADIKQYIGLPGVRARYEIIRSCLTELQRVGIIQPSEHPLVHYDELSRRQQAAAQNQPKAGVGAAAVETSMQLRQVALECEGMSGRFLRKLPFQAHAFYVQSATVSMGRYLQAMTKAVAKEREGRQQLEQAEKEAKKKA